MKLQYVTWSVCFTDSILRIQQVCQESPCHVLSHFTHIHAAEPSRRLAGDSKENRVPVHNSDVFQIAAERPPWGGGAGWGVNSAATDWDQNILSIDMPTTGCGSDARGVCLNVCVRAVPKKRVWNQAGLFVCLLDGATPPLPAKSGSQIMKTVMRSLVGFHARDQWASSNVCTQ